MTIQMIKFGEILNSRTAAREAVLRVKQIVNGSPEDIILDFSKVTLLTPSFADEIIKGIKEYYPDKKITYSGTEHNEALVSTLKGIGAIY
ncbi:MAG: DUF4325 domain-containing protein [Patescibacteria group bacterium]|jgi:hypothetical protein